MGTQNVKVDVGEKPHEFMDKVPSPHQISVAQ